MANSQSTEQNSFIANVNLLARELDAVSTILEVVNSGIIEEVLENSAEVAETMDELRRVAADAAGYVSQAENAASDAESILNSTQQIVTDFQTVNAQATTLDPATPASAVYDHTTNTLQLGIPRGIQGIQGIQGVEGVRGYTGPQGIQGPQGVQGPIGPQGTGVNILGIKTSISDLPPTGAAGAAWFVGTEQPYPLFIWDVDNAVWVNSGPISGPQGEQGLQGEQGEVGPALNILGSKETVEDLPPTGTNSEAWLVDGNLWMWGSDILTWFNAGNLKGPQGEQGPQGDQGPQGLPGKDSGGTLLTSNVTYYLSQTGNDAHSGLTATADGTTTPEGIYNGPKGTWLGISSLLAKTSPGRFTVTVKVSGLIPGNITFKLPQYMPANLVVSGTDQSVDGFSEDFRVLAGGFQFDRIRVGQLEVGAGGVVYSQGGIIRFTGSSVTSFAIGANTAMGKVDLVNCTLEYAGDFTDFIYCTGGDIGFSGCSYTPIGTPTFSGKSIRMNNGGIIAIDNVSSLPAGGTIVKVNPGFANIQDIVKVVTQTEYDSLDGTRVTNGVLYLISEVA